MGGRLIITNGDSAAARIREARIAGEILSWRDILHEGPVPASLSLEELSAVRAQFLAQRGWSPEEELRTAFKARDALIRQHGSFDTIILWFEHDLYGQLQLLQILDFFAGENRRAGLFLIQAGKHLSEENPRALKGHFHLMESVSEAHLALGRLAWNGFRAPTPEPWASLLRLNTHILPFLRLAMLRLLDELPDPRSGLPRTEWTILSLISQGVRTPRDLYRSFLDSEEVYFMGDWSFYHALDQLGGGGNPLIAGLKGLTFAPGLPEDVRDAYLDCELSFTHLGYSILSGNTDALLHRRLDRDIGGFHLQARAPWRWDRASRRLLPPPGAGS
ncbi:MAG: DUF1835 domain-containing protein [Rhodomicrobium sp.]|nr:DUF1835 domain-containing protein [Rhodomicrobium sp.]